MVDLRLGGLIRAYREVEMKYLVAAFAVLLLNGVALADDNASRFKIENGRIVVAQSYCGICFDNATACRLGCNGSGTCIQSCDNALRDCRDQNCGLRRW